MKETREVIILLYLTENVTLKQTVLAENAFLLAEWDNGVSESVSE